MPRVFETFVTSFTRRLPEWITSLKGDGTQVWFALSTVLDGFAQRAYEGIYARFPTYAPGDALSHLGADRLKLRGVGETRDSYAWRLIGWLDQYSHPTRGSSFSMLTEARDYCGGDGIKVRLVDRRGNWYTIDRDGTMSYQLDTGNWLWDPIPASPQWGRLWLIIYPQIVPGAYKPWGRGAKYDGTWKYDGQHVWGLDAKPSEITTLREIVETWKSAGRRVEWIIYSFDDTAFDPASPEPDGAWYKWGEGQPFAPKRVLPDAVYLKGGATVTPYGEMIP